MMMKTATGRDVIIHGFKPRNSAGNLVTFPVKGSVKYGRSWLYQIWDMNGKTGVFGPHPDDLVPGSARAYRKYEEVSDI